jgi:hypothetical protein
MALQIYPEIIASGASAPNAKSYTVPVALTRYKIVSNFDAAVYTITTSPNTSQVTATFINGTSVIGSTTTVGGTVTYNLATAATQIYLITDTGTNVVATVTTTASALSGGAISGTIDTLTTTGTYNQTGLLYIAAFGGGGGGGGGGCATDPSSGCGTGGGGGGSGYITTGFMIANGPTSYVIGARGNGGAKYASASNYNNNPAGSGNAGGTTTFGNLFTALGGSPGSGGSSHPANAGAGGAGGGYGGSGRGGNSSGYAVNGSDATATIADLTAAGGTTGGGGGGGPRGTYTNFNTGTSGAGSGVGSGGNGAPGATGGNAAAGTGYASGGAGGSGGAGAVTTAQDGAAGAPGIVYVVRGF